MAKTLAEGFDTFLSWLVDDITFNSIHINRCFDYWNNE
jgi:hypothetical protein